MELHKSLSSLFIAIVISIAYFSSFNPVDADKDGFSVELMHRDSQNSPFYDPQQTPTQRLANAFRRSINRINHFYPTSSISLSPNSPKTSLTADQGEYLMKISIGTPPFDILAIADTGSDLIWTQCKPCDHCYKQDAPLFDPKSSNTYRDLSCTSSQCNYLPQHVCSSSKVCMYGYQYGDLSFTNGNLAVDTVTLASTSGRRVSYPKTIIGCGHDNDGIFSEKGSGVIGLGGGKLSLIRQLGSSIGGKFSYCLIVPYPIPAKNTSTLNFGDKAILSGKGVVSTPLITKDQDNFYYLTLEAISVGQVKIPYSGSPRKANIIIDSGTTLTLVPPGFFSELSSAVNKAVRGRHTTDPSGILELCYAFDSSLKVPILTAHFKGADVKLNPNTTFIEVAEGVVCLAFKASPSSIFGNLAQSNLLVGYDLESRIVSFKPTDCTTF